MRRRLETVAAFMVLGLALLMIRAVDLHWLQGDALKARADRQQFRQYSVNAPRGPIVDRNHRVLSESIEVPSVGALAEEFPAELLPKVAEVLQQTPSGLADKLKQRQGFVWLARQMTPTQAETIEQMNIPGVRIEHEWKRFHPLGPETGHILGFVGLDNHGLEGVERSFDAFLQGVEGLRVVQRDARGLALPGSKWLQQPKMGQELALTIDANIQSIAYTALANGVHKSEAKGGSVIVMNPYNGEVLAMASRPGYNPNNFRHHKPGQWRNRAITDVFEPGSAMKPFTIAAALESGKWHANSRIDCENGEFRVADYVIHDDHPEGWLTLTGILQRSSNIGAAKLALGLGAEQLHQFLGTLGFGKQSGISIGGESSGILLSDKRWGSVETANIAFGQGIAVTTLQMASAFSVLANGGMSVQPHIVAQQNSDEQQLRVIKESTSRKVISMLEAATSDEGTGHRAVPDGYRIAGKTGTAQKAHSGGYSKDSFTAVFAGMAPVEHPEVVIVVVVDEPKTSIYGGAVAAPVFREIAASTLPYLGIPPQRHMPSEWNVYQVAGGDALYDESSFNGLSLREAYQLAEQRGLALKAYGHGWVTRQSPKDITELSAGSVVEVWLNE